MLLADDGKVHKEDLRRVYDVSLRLRCSHPLLTYCFFRDRCSGTFERKGALAKVGNRDGDSVAMASSAIGRGLVFICKVWQAARASLRNRNLIDRRAASPGARHLISMPFNSDPMPTIDAQTLMLTHTQYPDSKTPNPPIRHLTSSPPTLPSCKRRQSSSTSYPFPRPQPEPAVPAAHYYSAVH